MSVKREFSCNHAKLCLVHSTTTGSSIQLVTQRVRSTLASWALTYIHKQQQWNDEICSDFIDLSIECMEKCRTLSMGKKARQLSDLSAKVYSRNTPKYTSREIENGIRRGDWKVQHIEWNKDDERRDSRENKKENKGNTFMTLNFFLTILTNTTITLSILASKRKSFLKRPWIFHFVKSALCR